jgi:succinyl-CoA synthetase beta subunit
VWLDEHDSKRMLAHVGIECPGGVLVKSRSQAKDAAIRLGVPAYVKGLISGKGRTARGGIVRIERATDAPEAFQTVTDALNTREARLEAAVTPDLEYYLAVGVLPGDDRVSIMLATSGGSGIEERRTDVSTIGIDPAVGIRRFHCRTVMQAAGVPREHRDAVEKTMLRAYRLLKEIDATLVEINPLGLTPGHATALDAHVVLDDYAFFRHKAHATLRSSRRDATSLAARLRADGIEFVPLNGRIGIVGLGAGLTMHIADWISASGGSPAFFFDATAAAVRDWRRMFEGRMPEDFASALTRGLAAVDDLMGVLMVNFTSGGTPVDALSKGMLAAVRDSGWRGPLITHVAGNRRQEAEVLLRDAGLSPAATLGEAVRAAVTAERGLA